MTTTQLTTSLAYERSQHRRTLFVRLCFLALFLCVLFVHLAALCIHSAKYLFLSLSLSLSLSLCPSLSISGGWIDRFIDSSIQNGLGLGGMIKGNIDKSVASSLFAQG